MEGPVEDTAGGGAGEKREEELPVHNPGPPCRQEVQPGLPLYYSCGRLVPTEEDAGSEVSEWGPREREEERRAEAEELGAAGELGAGRNYRCSYPRPFPCHPQTMTEGAGLAFLRSFLLRGSCFLL